MWAEEAEGLKSKGHRNRYGVSVSPKQQGGPGAEWRKRSDKRWGQTERQTAGHRQPGRAHMDLGFSSEHSKEPAVGLN